MKKSDNYEASKEAMHHTDTAAVEYDDGDSFDTEAWAAASDDEDAQEYEKVNDLYLTILVLSLTMVGVGILLVIPEVALIGAFMGSGLVASKSPVL